MKYSLVVLLLAITLMSCSSSSNASKEHWMITVATGGGFTGMTNGFSMIETGEVSVWSGMRGQHELTYKVGSISPEKAQAFKDTLIAVNLAGMNLNSPGNMSTYIELETSTRRDRITWGSADHPSPPAALSDWYSDFMKTCSSLEKQ